MKRHNPEAGFWYKAAAFIAATLLTPLCFLFAASSVMAYTEGWYYDSSASFQDTTRFKDVVWQCQADAVDDYYNTVGYGYEREYESYMSETKSETNYRFALYDADGTLLFDNHDEGDVFVREYSGTYSLAPIALDDSDDGETTDDPQIDTTEYASYDYTVASYVTAELTAQDEIYWAKWYFDEVRRFSNYSFTKAGLCAAAIVLLAVYLARTAGRQPDSDAITPGWQEKIPLDLYIAIDCGIGAVLCVCVAGAVAVLRGPTQVAAAVALLAVLSALVFAFFITLCTRIKLGGWWHGTIIYKLLRLAARLLGGVWYFISCIPLVGRTLLFSAAASIAILLLARYGANTALVVLLALLTLVAAAFAEQLRELQKGGAALAFGNYEARVNTKRLHGALKDHGENLNAISEGMNRAVARQLKSERMKTELITNVSHDIKTPLTSIVNYVDLLKKETDPERQSEYIEVLDRQAKRLKKLTVDLVEMSRAASGNTPCNPSARNVGELLEQAVGEYEEKFSAAGLEAVVSPVDEGLRCMADGTLMWRVLDNLLGNACKYAQGGTRVYIGAERQGDEVLFYVKNTSREKLNISPDELMERFVRGDSSRTSEGSGLGLSIASSLVELQKGKFKIEIDGDLFKAFFTVPAVCEAPVADAASKYAASSPETEQSAK